MAPNDRDLRSSCGDVGSGDDANMTRKSATRLDNGSDGAARTADVMEVDTGAATAMAGVE